MERERGKRKGMDDEGNLKQALDRLLNPPPSASAASDMTDIRVKAN